MCTVPIPTLLSSIANFLLITVLSPVHPGRPKNASQCIKAAVWTALPNYFKLSQDESLFATPSLE